MIGIVGNGFVGKATSLFGSKHIKTMIYDIDSTKCDPLNTTMEDIVHNCDLIFICVPTPMKPSGECDTSIVEKCISTIRAIQTTINNNSHIVVRSTVPVGFCAQWRVNHMPEFLTEANWEKDFKQTEQWIIGVADILNYRDFEEHISKLLQTAHDHGQIRSPNKTFVDTDTSEFIKYARNCYLAVKLSLCNEFYDFCLVRDIDYEYAMGIAANDKRIGKDYINVPGPDGKKGWGGVCLPKDTCSFAQQQRKAGLNPLILQSAIDRNNQYDRKEQDWFDKKNKGRTYT